MEYIIKHCSECDGELHVPKEIKTCICMYCGKTIHFSETFRDIAMEEINRNCTMEYKGAIGGIKVLIKDHENYLKNFTKNNYSDSFEAYLFLGRSALLPLERYAMVSDHNKEEAVKAGAEAIVTSINETVTAKAKGASRRKGDELHQYRYFLAVYTIPMLRKLELSISEELADKVIETWCADYPDFIFYKADYNELLAGFQRKSLCFVTTAICEELGKEEDCSELMSLRSFRDNYMMNTQENRKLVEEYYQLAPAIVSLINATPKREVSYRFLWRKYLLPCLEDLANHQEECCKERYYNMMTELKKKYVPFSMSN